MLDALPFRWQFESDIIFSRTRPQSVLIADVFFIIK